MSALSSAPDEDTIKVSPENMTQSTLFIPIASPPTPAPSPGPASGPNMPALVYPGAGSATTALRKQYLTAVLSTCTPTELLFISTTIAPLLKRDFIRSLPTELALHVLGFVDDVKTLARASQVSRYWRNLIADETVWRRMSHLWGFDRVVEERSIEEDPLEEMEEFAPFPMDPALEWLTERKRRQQKSPVPSIPRFSYRRHFRTSYSTMMNWRHGGHLLRAHRVQNTSDNGVVTSLALDDDCVVVGMANSRIHVFSARTGVLDRTLIGHDSGVWGVYLVSKGGYWGGKAGAGGDPDIYVTDGMRAALGLDLPEVPINGGFTPPGKKSDVSGCAEGWGQPNSLIVSGGCDKVLRVWDVKSGLCVYVLAGHTSTIRCIKVLHNRPIAVSGSRDSTVRVWDVKYGRNLRVLSGHSQSVRCLDVCGNRVVSGSYDSTCRLWDIDTGECLHVLRGHFHQIYSVAFDGVRIASGGLDTTVRVWDAESGNCLALLQGHTALVCQIQLSPTLLITGGSDGRVITFDLLSYLALHKIAAHDSSVTSLQFDRRFLVTGGNDGRVRLFDVETGEYARDLSEASESVWKVAYRGDVCTIMCRRAGKTVIEIWSFKSRED